MDELTAAIATLRIDLDDVAEDIWTDADLTRAIAKALEAYSLAAPFETYTAVATVADSRELSLASLDDLVKVFAVEWPLSQWPPSYVRFSLWGDTLTMLGDALGDGTNANVFYGRSHQLYAAWEAATAYTLGEFVVPTTANGYCYECTTAGTSHATTEPTWPTTVGNTVNDNTAVWTCRAYYPAPAEHDDILLLGASGYAISAQGVGSVNTLNTGGSSVDRDYRSEATRRLREFRAQLNAIGYAGRLRNRQLYTPSTPIVSKTRVDWP